MMPSTKIAQMVLLSWKKGVGRALDKKYLQMKSPEPLVQNLMHNLMHKEAIGSDEMPIRNTTTTTKSK